MPGILIQADTTSLQTPFLVFSILILSALVIGAFSYMQLSNRYYKAKDDLRKANGDLRKATRVQRKYQRLQKTAAKDMELRRQMKFALNASRICLYSFDISTEKLKFGKNIDHVLGLEPGEAKRLNLDQYEVYRSLVHPDDREMVDLELENLLRNKGSYEHTYRLLLPTGEHLIRASGELAMKNDAPHRIAGFIQDITGLKAA